MKRLFFLFFLVFFAGLVALFIGKMPGTLVLEWGQRTFAAPLWFIIFIFLFIFFIIYFLWKILYALFSLPFVWRAGWIIFRKKKTEQLFREAVEAQVLGEAKVACQKYKKLGHAGYFAPHSYYMASVLADKINDPSLAEVLLLEAGRCGGSGSLIFNLLKIDHLIAKGAYLDAKNQLAKLSKNLTFESDSRVKRRVKQVRELLGLDDES